MAVSKKLWKEMEPVKVFSKLFLISLVALGLAAVYYSGRIDGAQHCLELLKTSLSSQAESENLAPF